MTKSIRILINECRLFIVFILILISSSSFAQYNLKAAADSGSMHIAIYWIRQGQTGNAKMECKKVLQRHPARADASVLLARIYSWEKKFDSARTLLNGVLRNQPNNPGALNALINVELWTKHYDQALVYAGRGIATYPKSADFLAKKSKIYEKQGKYAEASKLINKTLQLNPHHKEALQLQEILKHKKPVKYSINAVGVKYQNDQFNKTFTPWNYVSAYYYTIRKWGGLSANVNYANRFNKNGIQYELNISPRITKSLRANIGTSYSNDFIFARYNVSAALYQRVLKIAEVEAGARYLLFKSLAKPILIYTAGLSVMNKHWRGTIRTYLTPQTAAINQSYQLSARYAFKNINDRLVLTLNTGLAPANYLDTINNKGYIYPRNSRRIELSYQRPVFSKNDIMKMSVGYEKNEYFSGIKRDRISLGIGIEHLF